MRVAGVILAGGTGRRMGGEKPLTPFAGGTLIEAVIARAAPQVPILALNIPPTRKDAYVRFGYPLVMDSPDSPAGPLAGLLAGLAWLKDADWLATFPSDAPFLPSDLVVTLSRVCARDRPAVIRAGGEIESLCALWPRSARARIMSDSRIKSVRDALFALEARIVAHDRAQDFFNANTPEDLALAEARMPFAQSASHKD